MSLDCPPSCPFVVPTRDALRFPVGQLHRLARPDGKDEVDETRRNVLKLAAVAGLLGAGGLGFAGGALQYAQPPVVGESSYQRTQLLDLDGTPLTAAKAESEYNVATADLLVFNYPLENEPNFFLNVAPAPGSSVGATNVPFGVGSQKSLVAYSAICQHLGCPEPALSYYPPGASPPNTPGGKTFYIHCSCHGSTYDVTNSAANLTGPAVLPLPQVILEEASDGTIWATGMTPNSPTVNGHLNTLQGDYPVGASAQIRKTSPIIINTPW